MQKLVLYNIIGTYRYVVILQTFFGYVEKISFLQQEEFYLQQLDYPLPEENNFSCSKMILFEARKHVFLDFVIVKLQDFCLSPLMNNATL